VNGFQLQLIGVVFTALAFLAATIAATCAYSIFKVVTADGDGGKEAPVQALKAPEETASEVTGVIPPVRVEPPFAAPTVGNVTLKEWLIHRTQRDNVWNEFVEDFYAKAASNYRVRPYFIGKPMNEIKRKFLATLLIVTDKGVDERAAKTLVERHAHLGITGEAYDSTMGALEETLEQYQVPENTIAQMVPLINYFGEHMVTK